VPIVRLVVLVLLVELKLNAATAVSICPAAVLVNQVSHASMLELNVVALARCGNEPL
jgi:hypothetical protein